MSKMLNALLPLLGLAEKVGRGSNPKILEMARTVAASDPALRDLDDVYGDDDIPWCGLAVAYAAVVAGYKPSLQPLWALSWAKWGDDAGGPLQGSVAVKKRNGGGHVGLVHSVSRDGQTVYLLGGNQANKLSIAAYPRSVFVAFRKPAGRTLIPAPVWKGQAAARAASEA